MSDEHMSDKDMDAVLREWTQDAPAGQPDRSRVVGDVVRQLGSTRRRRRRWWLQRLFSRKPDEPAAVDKAQYQPSPIPASNGHTPTVIGRTTSMLSPVKAITAGALVFAIGGAFLIAQPFDRQGGGVPGAESGVAAAPAWVTATVSFTANCDFGDTAIEDGVTQERGMNCQGQQWMSDDPRLDGTANVAHNADSFDVDGQGYSLVTSVVEVSNDTGGWQCTNADRVVSPADTLFQTSRLDGDRLSRIDYGDNDGLSAIHVIDFTTAPKTVEGLIFPGEMPPMPDFPTAE